MTLKTTCSLALAAALISAPAQAQDLATDDPVIASMWTEGMERSQLEQMAHELLDSIGPRLTGSSALREAQDWVLAKYADWGVEGELQQYGTWRGWERGITHIDLLEPRIRTLNGTMLAWSVGTDGPVQGEAIVIPADLDRSEWDAWVQNAAGKFLLLNEPEPTCRAPESWAQWATPESIEAMEQKQQERLQRERNRRAPRTALLRAAEQNGALGVIQMNWSRGWGANKIFSSPSGVIPGVHLSCEDYGLVYRLAEGGSSPVIRLDAQSEFTGEQPQYNVIGTLPGTELPNEYVLLTAHLDSWDGASGATDNGTGSLMMLEAMRILKEHYPNPRRTIIVAHWGAEEQGLIGSGAWAHDNPEVSENLQAAFNQDNGTWRIDFIRMQGFLGAGEHFGRWLSAIPDEITRHIELDIPGMPETGGSDHMSFICRQAAGFRLQSNYPDYRQYTWHTDLDTLDKIVFDDLRNNATLAAMIAYMASEDPVRMETNPRVLPGGREWQGCRPPRRSYGGN